MSILYFNIFFTCLANIVEIKSMIFLEIQKDGGIIEIEGMAPAFERM